MFVVIWVVICTYICSYICKKSQWGVVLANAKVVIYVVIYSKIKGMILTNLQCL